MHDLYTRYTRQKNNDNDIKLTMTMNYDSIIIYKVNVKKQSIVKLNLVILILLYNY